MKSARKSISTKQKIVYALVSLLVLAVGYIAYLHITDYMKFMTLRSDMKQLQAEFNKIDAGWEYTEYCKAKGEKFKENEASSCGVSIFHEDQLKLESVYQYIDSASFSRQKISRYSISDGTSMISVELVYEKYNDVNCEIAAREINDVTVSNFNLYCSDSARNFYFSRLP